MSLKLLSADDNPTSSLVRLILMSLIALAMFVLAIEYGPLKEGELKDMIQVSITTIAIRAPMALVSLFVFLRAMDYIGKINFSTAWSGLSNGQAIYLGARFIGVCWLLGAIYR